MKRPLRKIVVDNVRYNWLVNESLWPEGYLKVWIDGDKSKPWLVVEFTLIEAITPAKVAYIIRQALEVGVQTPNGQESNCKYENDNLLISKCSV